MLVPRASTDSLTMLSFWVVEPFGYFYDLELEKATYHPLLLASRETTGGKTRRAQRTMAHSYISFPYFNISFVDSQGCGVLFAGSAVLGLLAGRAMLSVVN